jgi:hypothetical protein
MVKPTGQELLEEVGYKKCFSESDPSWRHGSYETGVWHRESDHTYWEACYRVSTDGETHELRDGEAEDTIHQVIPETVETTIYKSIE